MDKKGKSKNHKRVVVISDLHCGHRVGLTPSSFQSKVSGGSRQRVSQKFYKVQVALWNAYMDMIEKLGKIDVLIVNGDCIDGRGERSGSTELLYVDRNIQVAMAAECINHVNADSVLMVRGTPYHTGYSEEYEDLIAEKVNALKVEDHAWYDINGVIFDVKHNVGSSTIPHGRSTAISKEALWNLIWAERNEQPKADILIRSHVHYMEGRFNTDTFCLTTPALQGMGSKFGAKMCSGTVDFGLIWFDVQENGKWDFDFETIRIKEQKAKALKL